jgi:hypothetical protein
VPPTRRVRVVGPPDGTRLVRVDFGMRVDGCRVKVVNLGGTPDQPLWLSDQRAVGDPWTDDRGIIWQQYCAEADWYRARDLGDYPDGALRTVEANRVWVEHWEPQVTHRDVLIEE